MLHFLLSGCSIFPCIFLRVENSGEKNVAILTDWLWHFSVELFEGREFN